MLKVRLTFNGQITVVHLKKLNIKFHPCVPDIRFLFIQNIFIKK